MRSGIAAAAVLFLCIPPLLAQDRGSVLVHLADGTSLPLHDWSLSYELASWRAGMSPLFASLSRVPAASISVERP